MSSLAERKNVVYISFKRYFITDHSLLKVYNLEIYQNNDLETFGNIRNFSKYLKLEVL